LRARAAGIANWAIALAIVGVILAKGDLSALRQLTSARLLPLGVSFLCSILVLLASCFKWRLVVRHHHPEAGLSWGHIFHYYALARLTGMFLPMPLSDMGVRMASLRVGHRVSVIDAGYTVYAERSFDLLAMLLSAAPAVLFLSGRWTATQATLLYLAVVAVVTAVLLRRPLLVVGLMSALFEWGRRWLRRIPRMSEWTGAAAPRRADETLLPGRDAFLLYAVSLVILWLMTLRFYSLLVAVRVEVGFIPLYFCVAIAQAVSVLAFTPGGLGILEAGWMGLFSIIGMRGDQILLAVLSARAYAILAAAALALLGWLVVRAPRARASAKEGPSAAGS